MLVFGALSFQVLADDTLSVKVNSAATQSLTHADVQELLSWLNHYSQNYYNRSWNNRSSGLNQNPIGYNGGVEAAPMPPPQMQAQY